VGRVFYPILDSLFSYFELLFPDKNRGPIHPFRPHRRDQGRKSCDSIQPERVELKGNWTKIFFFIKGESYWAMIRKAPRELSERKSCLEEITRTMDKETIQSSCYVAYSCVFVTPRIFSFARMDIKEVQLRYQIFHAFPERISYY
jgi:hypothetical protein